MTDNHCKKVDGIIACGHKVASGSASDSPYPRGTIEMQAPFFEKLGLDLTNFFKGTLNVSISPSTFRLARPEFTFRGIEWTDRHPPEDFSFSRCRILFKDAKHDGLIYYPHPETKKRHFQNPSIIEIIAPLIPEIEYGCRIGVEYNPLEITINHA
ncbi:MAG: hypothetical protein EA367_02945 [Leptolyngbya sp. DLM2.Bin15]|nr:MAG: hypothetical protein EA367_02945 [Leptolyngbya sp. DLM2.Bin15]